MGYESKIIIVHKINNSMLNSKGRCYAHDYASFDMGKVYPLSDILRRKPATDCYFFSAEVDEEIVEDCYGDPLTETPVSELLQIVDDIIESGETYFMYRVLRDALNAFDCEMPGNLVALHYGY